MSMLLGMPHMWTNRCVVSEQREGHFFWCLHFVWTARDCFSLCNTVVAIGFYWHPSLVESWRFWYRYFGSTNVSVARLDVKSSNSIADSGTSVMPNLTDIQRFDFPRNVSFEPFWTTSVTRIFVLHGFIPGKDHLQHPCCPRISARYLSQLRGDPVSVNHPGGQPVSIRSTRYCMLLNMLTICCQKLNNHPKNFWKMVWQHLKISPIGRIRHVDLLANIVTIPVPENGHEPPMWRFFHDPSDRWQDIQVGISPWVSCSPCTPGLRTGPRVTRLPTWSKDLMMLVESKVKCRIPPNPCGNPRFQYLRGMCSNSNPGKPLNFDPHPQQWSPGVSPGVWFPIPPSSQLRSGWRRWPPDGRGLRWWLHVMMVAPIIHHPSSMIYYNIL